MLVCVDDLLVIGSSISFISQLITDLCHDFPITDLEKLHYFLGIEAVFSPTGLLLSQQQYILDLLHKTNMSLAKPVKTPMAVSDTLSAFTSPTFDNPTLYRSTVGSLQYLLFTRLDLAFAIGKVSQFLHDPRLHHRQAIKLILRYLKHTSHLGLHFSPSSHFNLTIFTDADWAGCSDDRRSTSGFLIFFGHALVSWSSKKTTNCCLIFNRG